MPLLHLLAGPNGSGKYTYVRDVLTPATQIAESRRRNQIDAGLSFISETVFSHPSKVRLVSDAVDAGYLVHLDVIMVPVDLSLQRVRERVRRGGHAVPEHKVRDRYQRLWKHVAAAIQIVDIAEVFDNSSARAPFRPCATYRHGVLIGAPEWPKWVPDALLA